jgi:hypothetical protein
MKMKTFICLTLCLLVFSGCILKPRKKSSRKGIDDRMKSSLNDSTKEMREEAKRLKAEYAKYKSGEMKLEKFSEVK